MGKTRPPERNKQKKNKSSSTSNGNGNGSTSKPKSSKQLLSEATQLLEVGEIQAALPLATKALKNLRRTANTLEHLPALSLCGEISLQLGDVDSARSYFLEAATADPTGDVPEERGGGPEKFFWLAQLSEEGGYDSVGWYEKGAEVLRKRIAKLVVREDAEEDAELRECRGKLANALCGIAEVFMTDLSFDDAEAEAQCNKAVEEALLVAPDQPTTLQTAASVRISQLRKEDAQQLLRQSLELWKDLDSEDADVPDFATRISLSRLLMEAELEDEAIEVLERLIREDDMSVEAWYLGGWCLHLLAQREKAKSTPTPTKLNGNGAGHDEEEELLRRSRSWLVKSLALFEKLDYEDEPLHEHAMELVKELNDVLGELVQEEEGADSGDEGWEDEGSDGDEDEDEDEDEEMGGG